MFSAVRETLRIVGLLGVAVALVGFAASGCSGNDGGDNGSGADPINNDQGVSPNGGGGETGAEDTPAAPRRLRDPWLGAMVGDTGVYRVYAVPGDAEFAEEERWSVRALTPPSIRVYTGGGEGAFGPVPIQVTTRTIEVPRRESGIEVGNWWLAEEAQIPAGTELPTLTLASGQELPVLEVSLDDGSRVWISEAAPHDRVVRHENAEGEVVRELLAHGTWLGTFTDGEASYHFRGTEVVIDDEEFSYRIERHSADTIVLALTDDAGDATETLVLEANEDNGYTLIRGDSRTTLRPSE